MASSSLARCFADVSVAFSSLLPFCGLECFNAMSMGWHRSASLLHRGLVSFSFSPTSRGGEINADISHCCVLWRWCRWHWFYHWIRRMSLAVAQLVQLSLNPENRVVINAFDYYFCYNYHWFSGICYTFIQIHTGTHDVHIICIESLVLTFNIAHWADIFAQDQRQDTPTMPDSVCLSSATTFKKSSPAAY